MADLGAARRELERILGADDVIADPLGLRLYARDASMPLPGSIVISTAKMRAILEVRTDDRLAWVEPGLFNLDLSTHLRPTGFTYAPDPSSQQTSSIGGNVNTNAGGPHCLLYGVTSAHVLAMDV